MLFNIDSLELFEKHFKDGIKGEMRPLITYYNGKYVDGVFSSITLKSGKKHYIFLHNSQGFSPFSQFGYVYGSTQLKKEEGFTYQELVDTKNQLLNTNYKFFDEISFEKEYHRDYTCVKFDLSLTKKDLFLYPEYKDLLESNTYVKSRFSRLEKDSTLERKERMKKDEENYTNTIEKYHVNRNRGLYIGKWGWSTDVKLVKSTKLNKYGNSIYYYASNNQSILDIYGTVENEIKNVFNPQFQYYRTVSLGDCLIVKMRLQLSEIKEIDTNLYIQYNRYLEVIRSTIIQDVEKNKDINFNVLEKEIVIDKILEGLAECVFGGPGFSELTYTKYESNILDLLKTETNNYLSQIKREEERKKDEEEKKKRLREIKKKAKESKVKGSTKFQVTTHGSFTGFITRTYEVTIPGNLLEQMSPEEIESYLHENYSESTKVNEDISIDDDYSEFQGFTSIV